MAINDDIIPDFERNTPFRVPNGYFDQLPERIASRCNDTPTATVTTWHTAIKGMLGLAAGFAALALMASAAYFYMQKIPTPTAAPSQPETVTIVHRSIEEYDDQWERLQRAKQRQQIMDSLNDFTYGKNLRYANNKEDFSSISEEKWDTPQTHNR